MKATLPQFLAYKTASDLVRLGRDYDGGYLASRKDIENSRFLVGLGINDDWSFEEDFVALNPVPVLAYDASVNRKFFRRQIRKSFNRLYRPKIIRRWMKVHSSYKRFFTGDRRHIEKYVGVTFGDRYIPMARVFEEVPVDSIFLKIDIEGSEYRIMDDLVANRDRISGMVIEFHECDLHLSRIQDFLRRLEMPVVHIHANNCSPLETDNGLPLALEITFSRYAETEDACRLPHELDMPNDRKREEIVPGFPVEGSRG